LIPFLCEALSAFITFFATTVYLCSDSDWGLKSWLDCEMLYEMFNVGDGVRLQFSVGWKPEVSLLFTLKQSANTVFSYF